MSTREVEERAVHTIKGLLLNCPRLDDYLKTADSGPLTDGHIDLHASSDGSVDTFRARVLVQVKGRTVRSRARPRTSFRFQVSHLQAYLSLKGVLFFVVDIDEETKESDSYYAILNPLKLDRYLKATRDAQRSVSIAVKRVPSGSEALEAIVELAHKKSDEKPGSVADLSVLDEAARFTIHTDGSIPFDGREPVDLDPVKDDYMLTAETKFGEQVVSQTALRFVPEDWLIGKPVELSIGAGGIVFEKPMRRRLDEETVGLDLSDTLRLLVKRPLEGRQSIKVEFETGRRLQSRIETLTFILGMLDGKGFSINGTYVELDHDALDDETGLRAHLEDLRLLADILGFIGADPGLVDLSEISDRQYAQLSGLHGPLVMKTEVGADLPGPGRIAQSVGRWRIELICFEGSEPGTFKVRHLFDPELMMHFAMSIESERGVERHLVTPYDAFVDDESFPYTLNLRLDGLVDYYRTISEYADLTGFATQTILRLVHGADLVPERRREFLSAATLLNEWLIDYCGGSVLFLINRYQIVARSRGLDPEERDEVRSIKHGAVPEELTRSLIAYACSVLLGDTEEADYFFDQLDPDKQAEVKMWPIRTLHDRGLLIRSDASPP